MQTGFDTGYGFWCHTPQSPTSQVKGCTAYLKGTGFHACPSTPPHHDRMIA